MSSRHPCSAVFPVILVASTVFSILSLPFFLYRLQPEADPSNLQDFQPILESQNRDVTIRYIGAALVLSVITGIGTIELQRRRRPQPALAHWQPSIQLDQDPVESFSVQRPALPSHRFASDTLASDTLLEDTLLEDELDNEQVELAEIDAASAIEASFLANHDEHNAKNLLNIASPQREELIAELDDLDQDYSTCRIWVAPLQRRLFAIQVEGQFYSFFRLLPSKEAARQTALQLSQNLHHTVITSVEQEFAVWIWQPEAEAEELEMQLS
jgi:hypothetical protein